MKLAKYERLSRKLIYRNLNKNINKTEKEDNMKKLAILSFVVVLILSGCVEKADNKNDTQSNIVNNIKIDANPDTISTSTDNKTQINVSDEDSQIKDGNSAGNIESEWCSSGSKITVNLPSGQAEFTVIGITTYTDKNGKTYEGLCKAEKVIKGGSSVRYFNKEGTIDIMKSESSSTDGSASAEASASASVSR